MISIVGSTATAYATSIQAQQFYDASVEYDEARRELNMLQDNEDNVNPAILYAAQLEVEDAEQYFENARDAVVIALGSTAAAVGVAAGTCAAYLLLPF